MGRWAQRTRRGGGPATAAAAITITNVFLISHDDGTVSAEFSAPINVADFDASAFNIEANDGGDVAQDGPTNLLYHAAAWEGVINVGDNWVYNDLVTNIPAPQSGVLV